jgi:prepilin-type N-terminal cleavage/methylation domain-containing protein/prepilin-type processing-associated H-X9-DG protein
MKRDGANCRWAFTLIELLVVVAIIALLISILLPSLARARDQAKAVVCASQVKELTNATTMWLIERQQERIKGNLGWGSRALRNAGGQTKLFACPTDKEPEPRPAVILQVVGTKIECTSDGIFTASRLLNAATGRWMVGFDDSSSSGGPEWLGADYDYDDVQFFFVAQRGQTDTKITATDNAGWDFIITDYKGKNAQRAGSGGPVPAPLIWGSYGINASAGLRGQGPGTIVLCEAEDWNVWPESGGDLSGGQGTPAQKDLTRSKGAPAQNDPAKLRTNLQYPYGGIQPSILPRLEKYMRLAFRHGARGESYPDVVDRGQPRQTANVGFLDAHVERLTRGKLLTNVSLWHPARKQGFVVREW